VTKKLITSAARDQASHRWHISAKKGVVIEPRTTLTDNSIAGEEAFEATSTIGDRVCGIQYWAKQHA
jgi:phage gp16-like protein